MALRFGLISIINAYKKCALNKDLNGGLGTADDYPGNGLTVGLIRYIKRKEDFEQYTQFNLVFQHPAMTPSEMAIFLKQAYRAYYLRLPYFFEWARFFLRNIIFHEQVR